MSKYILMHALFVYSFFFLFEYIVYKEKEEWRKWSDPWGEWLCAGSPNGVPLLAQRGTYAPRYIYVHVKDSKSRLLPQFLYFYLLIYFGLLHRPSL